MMQWILDILFYTVPAMEGVSYAVPAWLIPLAASAGSSLFNILGQRGETKKGNRLRDLRVGQQNKSLDAFRKAIGQIEGRADDIDAVRFELSCEIERCLAAELDDHAVALGLIINFKHVFERKWLEEKLV
jgi:hypothetical protein